MTKPKILVVDDEENIRYSLGTLLREQDYDVYEAEDGQSALALLESRKGKKPLPDLAFLDVRLPDIDGMQLMDQVLDMSPETSVIILTGYGNVAQSVEAMRKGAVDYILKPFNVNEILIRVDKTLEKRRLQEHVNYLSERFFTDWEAQYVVGPNPSMRKLYESIETVAQSHNTTVLIQGETGTGKELIARRIHWLSTRRERPFVEINATALTAELLESELFGHEAGAFTGALKAKKGLFEVANGGTLFLDEIGDMNFAMQAKLLRALQERKIRRVGGTEHIPIDIRLVTATNKNLLNLVKKKKFREDLYYRLNVIPLFIPALRDRKDDIESLVLFFVEAFNKEFSRSVKEISPAVIEALRSYSWPGNVRELRNVIERTMLLECRGNSLELKHLKFDPMMQEIDLGEEEDGIDSLRSSRIGQNIALELIEREHIEGVLRSNKGNKNQAAQILGIDRTTLYNKIKKYRIST